LRNRKLGGLKFTRQRPLFVSDGRGLRYYIADFYCHEKRLVVELDGPIHDRTRERDRDRDELICQLNLRVMRVNNAEIENDIEKVLKRLQD
jgi:leucyl-tRNA synthetase